MHTSSLVDGVSGGEEPLVQKLMEIKIKKGKKIPRKTTVYKYLIQRNNAHEYQMLVAINSPLWLTG